MNVCLHMSVHCSVDSTLFIFMLFVIVMSGFIEYMELILV